MKCILLEAWSACSSLVYCLDGSFAHQSLPNGVKECLKMKWLEKDLVADLAEVPMNGWMRREHNHRWVQLPSTMELMKILIGTGLP
jgi:hypothetical protein